MTFRKYQSVERHEPLQGDQKRAASKVAASKSRLDDETLTDRDRQLAEEEHRLASAKLAK